MAAEKRAIGRRIYAPGIVAAALAAALVLKLFALDLVIVRGVSMSPTIRSGTVALVARCAYGLRSPFSGDYVVRWAEPAPGDVVLVDPTANGSRRAVKRVFELGPAYMKAEAGTLSGRGGTVSLGAGPSAALAGAPYVGAGRAFVVGDNQGQSLDSRDYGSVPIEKIVGKVLLYVGGRPGPVEKTEYSKDAADDVDR